MYRRRIDPRHVGRKLHVWRAGDEIAQQANQARWANHTPTPKRPSTGPKRRQFRIGETVYTDVQTAALKTGVKVATLRQYVGRNPKMYAYVD